MAQPATTTTAMMVQREEEERLAVKEHVHETKKPRHEELDLKMLAGCSLGSGHSCGPCCVHPIHSTARVVARLEALRVLVRAKYKRSIFRFSWCTCLSFVILCCV